MQVRYARTIVGWLSQVSQWARSGCGEISVTAALELFGDQEVLPA